MKNFEILIKQMGPVFKSQGFKKSGRRKWNLEISEDVLISVQFAHMNTALQRGTFEIEISAWSFSLTRIGNPEMNGMRWPYATLNIASELLSQRKLPNDGRSIPIPESPIDIQSTIDLITEPLLSNIEVFKTLTTPNKIVAYMYSNPYSQGVGPSMVDFLYRKVNFDPELKRFKDWPSYRSYISSLDPEWRRRPIN